MAGCLRGQAALLVWQVRRPFVDFWLGIRKVLNGHFFEVIVKKHSKSCKMTIIHLLILSKQWQATLYTLNMLKKPSSYLLADAGFL